jgi:hypothetical protein
VILKEFFRLRINLHDGAVLFDGNDGIWNRGEEFLRDKFVSDGMNLGGSFMFFGLHAKPRATTVSLTVCRIGEQVKVCLESRKSYSGFRKIAPSGGRVSLREKGLPCTFFASAMQPPMFPMPLPPYSLASLLRISRQ